MSDNQYFMHFPELACVSRGYDAVAGDNSVPNPVPGVPIEGTTLWRCMNIGIAAKKASLPRPSSIQVLQFSTFLVDGYNITTVADNGTVTFLYS